jgi:hypothetical protein
MNAKAAKRIRYAVRCMGLSTEKPETPKPRWFGSNSDAPAKSSPAKRMITRFKREYKALPYRLRDVHQESHSFVLQVKHGNATRNFPA